MSRTNASNTSPLTLTKVSLRRESRYLAVTQKTFTFDDADQWMADKDRRVVMVVDRGMKIRFDADGNWGVTYVANVRVRRNRWHYDFAAFDKHGRSLFTVGHPYLTADRGRELVGHNSRRVVRDISRNFDLIAVWTRAGRCEFEV